MDIRSSKPILLSAIDGGAGLQFTIQADSIELCGDIVQDLFGRELQMSNLEAEGSFPPEMARLSEILQNIEQHNQMKTHFAANIAESINTLKLFIVKAEASLMINDM